MGNAFRCRLALPMRLGLHDCQAGLVGAAPHCSLDRVYSAASLEVLQAPTTPSLCTFESKPVHLLVEADFLLVRLQLWQVPRSTSNDPQQWLEAAAALPPGSTRTSTPAPVEQPLELPAPPAVPVVKAEPVDAGQAGPQKLQVGILITALVPSRHELA